VNELQLLLSVLSDSIHEIFTRLEIKFDFIIYENISLDALKVLNELHKRLDAPLKIQSFPSVPSARRRFKDSAVVFLDSLQRYSEFFHDHGLEYSADFQPKKFRFLIYVTKPFKVNKIGVNALSSAEGSIAQYSYFIVDYKGEFWFFNFLFFLVVR
jgi:hypothetical protein